MKNKSKKKKVNFFTKKEIKNIKDSDIAEIAGFIEKLDKKKAKKEEKALKKLEEKSDKEGIVKDSKNFLAIPNGNKIDGKTVKLLHDTVQVEGFEGWYITGNPKTAIALSSEPEVSDFEVSLYDNKNRLRGKAVGGVYNTITGVYSFPNDLEFVPHTQVCKLNEFLQEVIDNDGKLPKKEKIKKIKKFISKL